MLSAHFFVATAVFSSPYVQYVSYKNFVASRTVHDRIISCMYDKEGAKICGGGMGVL